LEKGILPTFDALLKLEADKKILAGGLPVADRGFVAFHNELRVSPCTSHDGHQNRKGAEVDLARETRTGNLSGIPPPKSEHVRAHEIATAA
jgi:hypothetical protein